MARIRGVLVDPRGFFAALPAPDGFPVFVAALGAAVHLAAMLVAPLLTDPTLVGATISLLPTFLFISLGSFLAVLVAEWGLIRLVGGPSVHAWSIAGATLCPSLVLAPAGLLAYLIPFARISWSLSTALAVGALLWTSVLVYFGVRVSAPSRAITVSIAHALLIIGSVTLLALLFGGPAA